MAVLQPTERNAAGPGRNGARVNDFSLVVATANGTGSQTANLALLRSIFLQGVPVHGKNVFPSNIQGLPTWFHIRASADGWVARQAPEIVVAYNARTLHEDVATVPPGGVLVIDEGLRGAPERDDVTTYRVPVAELMGDVDAKGTLKTYLANMTYLGVIAWLLGLPLDVVERALVKQFAGRRARVDANLPVVASAWRWADTNLEKRDPFRIEPMDATRDTMLITGNDAAALGSVVGGVSLAAWYPITPSTSLVDALGAHLKELRPEREDGRDWAIVQAEDELAAIGMVIGAGWAGVRAMTATSGPGLSLMAEFAGLGYFAELPAVVWDVQRVGPSTGLPTRTAQSDVAFAHALGHGDVRHPVLLPGSVEECFEFGWRAFDLAERLQTPVFVLSDLDLGMNTWMSPRFAYPDEEMDRGKVLRGDDVPDDFGRYRDVDGDGVPYRTVPGDPNERGAWFGRGTGHDADAVYSERPEDWTANQDRLLRKWATVRELVPAPELDVAPDADVLVVCMGSTRYAVEEARARLERFGATFSLMRLRALPIGRAARDALDAHAKIVVLEMNRNAQLRGVLAADAPDLAPKLASIAYLDGLPFTADQVTEWLGPHLGVDRARLAKGAGA